MFKKKEVNKVPQKEPSKYERDMAFWNSFHPASDAINRFRVNRQEVNQNFRDRPEIFRRTMEEINFHVHGKVPTQRREKK